MWCLQARRPEREQRETAGSTATFSLTVDDLPDVFKLSGSCFSSARRWRGSAGEWEGKRGQMREREGWLPERAPKFYSDRGFRSMVHRRWSPLGGVGGCAGQHHALSPVNR
jgi:hypothetical protein